MFKVSYTSQLKLNSKIMRINSSITAQTARNNRNNVSHKGAKELVNVLTHPRLTVKTLADPNARLSTVLLEGCVTGGRGYNAYKRGGGTELRERATDDIISAFFWMEGANILNKIGNVFGEKVLHLPTAAFDIGKDALRTPFNNLVEDLPSKGIAAKDLKKVEMQLSTFKFTKVLLSTILSTAFVGFVLPKVNQKITKLFAAKDSKKQVEAQNEKPAENPLIGYLSIDEFDNNISTKKKLSFKGKLEAAAFALENNKICKLVLSDIGITTGRVSSARNKDEGLEYLFRDVTSSFFYSFSTPLIYKCLQKLTKSSGSTTIDPVAAQQVHKNLMAQLGDNVSMNVAEFEAKTIGSLSDKAKELIGTLHFEGDVISLTELKNHVNDEALIEKAKEMAKLQPKQAGVGAVLTKQQVVDVFKNGSICEPKFMQKVFGEKFGEKLTSRYEFIPMEKITDFHDEINAYAKSVIDIAKEKNNGVVDKKLLEKINKKSFAMSAAFRVFAMVVSAFALGVVIPKLQYAITAKRTGSNAAPGLREYEQTENK